MASMTSDTNDTSSSSKHDAKKNTTRTRGLFHHCHPHRRKMRSSLRNYTSCLSVCLPVCLSVSQSVCLSVCLCLWLCSNINQASERQSITSSVGNISHIAASIFAQGHSFLTPRFALAVSVDLSSVIWTDFHLRWEPASSASFPKPTTSWKPCVSRFTVAPSNSIFCFVVMSVETPYVIVNFSYSHFLSHWQPFMSWYQITFPVTLAAFHVLISDQKDDSSIRSMLSALFVCYLRVLISKSSIRWI